MIKPCWLQTSLPELLCINAGSHCRWLHRGRTAGSTVRCTWGLLFACGTQSSNSIPGVSSAWDGMYTLCNSQTTHGLAGSGWFTQTSAVRCIVLAASGQNARVRWGLGPLLWILINWWAWEAGWKLPTKHFAKTNGVHPVVRQVSSHALTSLYVSHLCLSVPPPSLPLSLSISLSLLLKNQTKRNKKETNKKTCQPH